MKNIKILILIALISFSTYKPAEAINFNKKNLITIVGTLSTITGFYLSNRTIKIDFDNIEKIQITKTGKTTSVSTISRDRKLGSGLFYGGIIAVIYGLS